MMAAAWSAAVDKWLMAHVYDGLSLEPTPWLPLTDAIHPLAAGLAYLASVFLFRQLFRRRSSSSNAGKEEGSAIKYVSVAHFGLLTVASLVMFVGTLMAFVRMLAGTGWSLKSAFCVEVGRSEMQLTEDLRFWYYLYYLSKFLEFPDTFLLLWKGRPVGAMHIYHHFTIVIVSWLWVRSSIPFCAQGILFNTFVHVWMYYYYAVTQVGIVPWWKRYLTLLQIVQFVTSILLALVFTYFHFSGSGCRGWSVFIISTLFNATLLFLFTDFYAKSYKRPSKPKTK